MLKITEIKILEFGQFSFHFFYSVGLMSPIFYSIIFIKKTKNKLLNYNTPCFDVVRQYICIRAKIKNPGKLIVLLNQILTLK